MPLEFERRLSDFSVDVIDVDNAYMSHESNENQTLPHNYVMEHQHLNECNDDTSTLASTNDSIFTSSTDDHKDIELLATKSTVFPLQNIGQSIRGQSNQNPGSISIEHSSDVLFGSKTFFTGPVVIKQFIAESDAANHVNQKDEYSDVPTDTSEISNAQYSNTHCLNVVIIISVSS